MYAVVEAGGRQYQLASGRYVDVDMVAGDEQSEFVFDRVLMIVDGEQSTIGKPVVDGAKVVGKIIKHGKGPKLVVYKYRPKKGTRKRTGHRQGFTRIYINSIQLNGKALSEAKDEYKAGAAKPAADKAPAKAAAEPKAEKAAKTATKAAKSPAPKAEAGEKKAAPKKSTKKEQ